MKCIQQDTEKMYTQRVSHVVTVEDFLSLSVVPKATFSVEQPYALHIEVGPSLARLPANASLII